MEDKLIFAITLICLGFFGLRSFLPSIPLLPFIALFTMAGLIGCYFYLDHTRNKRGIDALSTGKGWLIG